MSGRQNRSRTALLHTPFKVSNDHHQKYAPQGVVDQTTQHSVLTAVEPKCKQSSFYQPSSLKPDPQARVGRSSSLEPAAVVRGAPTAPGTTTPNRSTDSHETDAALDTSPNPAQNCAVTSFSRHPFTSHPHSSSPDALLGPLRKLFPFASFNAVQSAVAPALLATNPVCASHGGIHPCNVVVGAPTGSGKTALLEIAIVALFRSYIEASLASEGRPLPLSSKPNRKAVYICPIKALAQEKFTSWSSKFGGFLNVVMETGDGIVSSASAAQHSQSNRTDHGRDATVDPLGSNMNEILTADILISTPERWDSITRRWRDGQASLGLVASIGLLLVDEVHVVGERRGAVLEAVVSRMKSISLTMSEKSSKLHLAADSTGRVASSYVPIRFVAVSGTIPNINDLASWLDVQPHNVFSFGDEVRPVQIRTKVIGFKSMSSNPFAFDKFLNFKLHNLILEYSGGKPSLVFCSSRKETAGTAQHLADEIARTASSESGGNEGGSNYQGRGGGWRGRGRGGAGGKAEFVSYGPLEEMSKNILLPDGTTSMFNCAMSAEDKTLRRCLLAGVAFHNAALTPGDRRLVEDLFSKRYISVLCTTTTLAMGVNLPARLVVIKGTTFYRGGCREDLPAADIIQMTGRAGRPGLDTEGVALILTSTDKAQIYNSITATDKTANPPLESHLHHAMIEHLNAEIALKTVTTVAMGVAWLKTTFLWIRIQKAPTYYGIKIGGPSLSSSSASMPPQTLDSPSTSGITFSALESFSAALIHDMITRLVSENCVKLEHVVREQVLFAADTCSSAAPLVDEEDVVVGDFPSPYEAFQLSFASHHQQLLSHRHTAQSEVNSSLSKYALASTRIGRLVTKYYIDFETVVTFNEYVLWRMVSKRSMSGAPSDEGVYPDEELGSGSDSDRDSLGPPDGAEPVASKRESKGFDGRLPPAGIRHLLELISRANEFGELRIRLGDKGVLNAKNKAQKFPLRHIPSEAASSTAGREVKEGWQKIFLLAQMRIVDPSLQSLNEDFSLRNDATRMWQTLPRIAKFLTEYCTVCCLEASTAGTPESLAPIDQVCDGRGPVVRSAWTHMVADAWCLQRSIEQSVWWDSVALTRQLEGVGEAISRSLSVNASIHGIEDVIRFACPSSVSVLGVGSSSSPTVVDLIEASEAGRRIEMLCNKAPPFGRMLVQQCLSIPRLLPPRRTEMGHEITHLHSPPVVVVRRDGTHAFPWIQYAEEETAQLLAKSTKALSSSLTPGTTTVNLLLQTVALLNQRNEETSAVADIEALLDDVSVAEPVRVGFLVGCFSLRLQPRTYFTLKADPLLTRYTGSRSVINVSNHHNNVSGRFTGDPTLESWGIGRTNESGDPPHRPLQVVSSNQIEKVDVALRSSWFTVVVYVDNRRMGTPLNGAAVPTEHLLLHRRFHISNQHQGRDQSTEEGGKIGVTFQLQIPIAVSLQRLLQLRCATTDTIPQHPTLPIRWLEAPKQGESPTTVSGVLHAQASTTGAGIVPIGNSVLGGYQVVVKTTKEPSIVQPTAAERTLASEPVSLLPHIPVVVLVINETYLGVDERIELLLPLSSTSVSVRCPTAKSEDGSKRRDDVYFSPANMALLASISESTSSSTHHDSPPEKNTEHKKRAHRADELPPVSGDPRRKGEKAPRYEDCDESCPTLPPHPPVRTSVAVDAALPLPTPSRALTTMLRKPAPKPNAPTPQVKNGHTAEEPNTSKLMSEIGNPLTRSPTTERTLLHHSGVVPRNFAALMQEKMALSAARNAMPPPPPPPSSPDIAPEVELNARSQFRSPPTMPFQQGTTLDPCKSIGELHREAAAIRIQQAGKATSTQATAAGATVAPFFHQPPPPPPRRRILVAGNDDDDLLDNRLLRCVLGASRHSEVPEAPLTPLAGTPPPRTGLAAEEGRQMSFDQDDVSDVQLMNRGGTFLQDSRDADSSVDNQPRQNESAECVRERVPSITRAGQSQERPPVELGATTPLTSRPCKMNSVTQYDAGVGDTTGDGDSFHVMKPTNVIRLPPSPPPREVAGGALMTSNVPVVTYNPMATILQSKRPDRAKKVLHDVGSRSGTHNCESSVADKKAVDTASTTKPMPSSVRADTTATTPFLNGGRESPSVPLRCVALSPCVAPTDINKPIAHNGPAPTLTARKVSAPLLSGLDTITLRTKMGLTDTKGAVDSAFPSASLQPVTHGKLASMPPLSQDERPSVITASQMRPVEDRTERRLRAVQQFLAQQQRSHAAAAPKPHAPQQHPNQQLFPVSSGTPIYHSQGKNLTAAATPHLGDIGHIAVAQQHHHHHQPTSPWGVPQHPPGWADYPPFHSQQPPWGNAHPYSNSAHFGGWGGPQYPPYQHPQPIPQQQAESDKSCEPTDGDSNSEVITRFDVDPHLLDQHVGVETQQRPLRAPFPVDHQYSYVPPHRGSPPFHPFGFAPPSIPAPFPGPGYHVPFAQQYQPHTGTAQAPPHSYQGNMWWN